MSSKNRKVYQMGDRSIREFFSSPTRYLSESINRESEFEKPYLDDDRGRMHALPPWPDWPPMPPVSPWPPLPPFDGPSPGLPGCAIVCYPPHNDCDNPVWCHPSIWCGSDIGCTLCSWTVDGATRGYTPHLSGVGGWGIDVWIDKDLLTEGKALITVCMTDPCKNICCEEVEVTCKVCPPETVVSWDNVLSDETVARNGIAGVYVQDGLGPYTWSVAGTGFSIPATTAGVQNVLSADNTACGTATITVTDYCGDSTTGYVRCDTGNWCEITFDSCIISGAITEGDGETRIQDKWKLVEVWGVTCSSAGFGCSGAVWGMCVNNYDTCHCLEPGSCHTTMGCTQCLNHGGICNQAGYAKLCFSPADCLCCVDSGDDCDGAVNNVVMCGKNTSKLYEWKCTC